MIDNATERQKLRRSIAEALELIQGHSNTRKPAGSTALVPPLGSLLDRCRDQLQKSEAVHTAPVHLLHHFACTGGSLISKCIAALPNTVLLSEIDPLSTHHVVPIKLSQFTPTDMIVQLHFSRYDPPEALLTEMFQESLAALHRTLSRTGQRLVLRDHPHSRFCVRGDIASKPTLREIVAQRHPVRSLVTVRHPLASYLSLSFNGWTSFDPATLEEYAKRYIHFLDRHADCPIIQYEDLVTAPDDTMEQVCEALDLPMVQGIQNMIGAVSVSGNSGRVGNVITPRPPREVPDAVAAELSKSPTYDQLCDRLGYDPSTLTPG